MKEMIYRGTGPSEILNVIQDGDCLGVVINCRGSHPCAYIQFPEIDKVKDYDSFWIKNETDFDMIHGGFTFLGYLDHLGLNGLWIGWDYAHCGDYTQMAAPDSAITQLYLRDIEDCDEKRWTTEEITESVKMALHLVREGQYEIDEEEES